MPLISCIFTFVKLLERLVYESFLITNNKLSKTQHSFRKHHSCQTQLLETIHHWAQSLDRRKSVHVAYLDFSKAFDSVPHHCLLLKLGSEGVF